MSTLIGTVAVAIGVAVLAALLMLHKIENSRDDRKEEPGMINNRKFLAMMNRLPLQGQRLAWVDFFLGGSSDDDVQDKRVVLGAPLEEANVITSLMDISSASGVVMHKPVIDIDHRVVVVESTTGGHSHLYVDVPLPWEDLVKLLEVLAEIGLVEPGYVNASKARGYTAVRLPWVSKETLTDQEVREA